MNSTMKFASTWDTMCFAMKSAMNSIPRWDTMIPKNFPEATAKTHFAGFKFILYLCSVLKVSFISSGWLRP